MRDPSPVNVSSKRSSRRGAAEDAGESLSVCECSCKLLVDTPCRKLTVSLFVLLIAGWFYFRLYTFSSAALLPIFRAIQARQSHAEAEGWSFFVFILLTLFLMNIYW